MTMPDLKEKLVELLDTARYKYYGYEAAKDHRMRTAKTEAEFDAEASTYEIRHSFYARELIAHGVTVQELDGCEYCKEYEDLPEHFVDGKPVGRVFDTCIQPDENGLWHLEVPVGADIGIRFCPMCGRKLPQPPKGE